MNQRERRCPSRLSDQRGMAEWLPFRIRVGFLSIDDDVGTRDDRSR